MSESSAFAERYAAVRDRLLVRDALRLDRLLAQSNARRLDAHRFERDVQQALLRAENRARLRPQQIDYPEALPVVQMRETLLAAMRAHPVVVVCGETGSGKTTQLPKLCLELGYGMRGQIGHTQPRRLAARSIASRIAAELKTELGQLVGYETRFDRRVSDASLIKLMTDGILLAELGRDPLLAGYDAIIIDEAHERTLNIDFLLGWLKRILPQRPDLKVIVTSATLDPERLSRHFGGAPIIEVSGRTYPVEIRYRPLADDSDAEGAIADAVAELWSRGASGGILVFLPGEREIRDAARVLGGRFPDAEILPLYSRLASSAQDLVFLPARKPRIVLATNVAETSLTVPGIRYVIDTGTARISRFAPRTGVQQLHIEPVSQASANQRAGRCGRLGPGTCIRLYAADDFAARPAFTDPEIKRANLAGVLLQMAALGLGRIETFPWVDAPEGRHVAEATRVLEMLGAFDERGMLTPLGRELARLPLDPCIGRIALAGRGTPVETEVFVLAAALSVQDPHEVPADAPDAAREKHAQWRHRRSDFLSLLLLWQRFRQWSASASNRQLRRLCREHFVSFLRLEEWEAVYHQICELLGSRTATSAPNWTAESLEAVYAPIHQALLAGLIDHIGQKLPEQPEYQGPKGRRFRLHPGSALAKKMPPWVMSAQLAQTSRLYARTNAAIEPQWLESVAGHLLKRSLLHPTWHPERGEVLATEHLSLLGLALGTRARHYGSTHPAEARAIFIREALVNGRIPKKPAFLEHNLGVIAAIREKETRLRRPDLLADTADLFRWYDERLPPQICTTAALKRALADPTPPRLAERLTMTERDALRPGANADVGALFPDHLDIGGIRVALSYHHEPGAAHDGVTFHIPVDQAHALPPEVFDWLVPGLRPDLIEGLIRTLPNRLRRAFTPIAAFAQAAGARLDPAHGALLPQLCRALEAMTGVAVTPADFAPAQLEPYLKPRFQLLDADGRVLASGDSLAALRQHHRGAARAALARAAARDETLARWTRTGISDWDFDDLPTHVVLATGARAHPALDAQEERIDLRLFESAEAAARAHHAGVRALLLLRLSDRLRDLGKQVRRHLGLLATAFALDVDVLARQLAERSADAVLLDPLPYTRAQFQAALEKRGAFSTDAQRRLEDIARWLGRARELRARIEALGTRWPDASADLRDQLGSLFAPGFIHAIPEPQWQRIALYLRAIDVRLERLTHKPARDAALLHQIAPYVARLPHPFHPARWLLEEWRIALFAQELRAQGAPSAAKIDAALRG
ncbi:ATP-dependent RNA helicase HrpA [Fontimonas thermophila]|uniref:ATP-dependent RNA helicase HrpA n=1 Tax=Fontimonas thermophila TaxID=1076937 RepID=UPI0013565964|nr:ATP-dependent RNA helicase HrpA [Fontimonas thermophila]